MLLIYFVHGGDMLVWDYKNMHRRHGTGILDGSHQVIFIENLARCFPSQNPAKHTPYGHLLFSSPSGDELLGHRTRLVILKLLRRCLHEIGGRRNERSTDLAVEGEFNTAHSVDDHTG